MQGSAGGVVTSGEVAAGDKGRDAESDGRDIIIAGTEAAGMEAKVSGEGLAEKAETEV